MMVGALLIFMVVSMGVVWVLGVYNHLCRLRHVADQAWAGVEEFLMRRSSAVSEALSHIAKGGSVDSTLETLLVHAVRAQSMSEHVRAEHELSIGLERLVRLIEADEQKASDTTLKSVLAHIERLEQDIHLAQRFYNGAVKQYNHFLRTFPASIIAQVQGLHPVEYFELSD